MVVLNLGVALQQPSQAVVRLECPLSMMLGLLSSHRPICRNNGLRGFLCESFEMARTGRDQLA